MPAPLQRLCLPLLLLVPGSTLEKGVFLVRP
jgi:hypothetical protein